jgi:two-component system cell cycle sensor histidine kinase/response regulator CckA
MKILRTLIVEDSKNDAHLLERHLSGAGYDLRSTIVQTSGEMKIALAERKWDIVLSDYTMPRFTGLDALIILRESASDIPFIIISGTIGEEVAVEAMLAGVDDYVMKGNLQRLVPAIEREVRNAVDRQTRKQAEDAARASEARLSQLVEASIIGIIIVNVNGTILEANDVFLKMVGYDREELNAETLKWDKMTPPEMRSDTNRAIRELMESGETRPREKEYIRKDGSRVPVMVGGTMIKGSASTIMAFVLDITATKALEEQLRQAQKLESVGLLAGGIAHDFNNMLTAINGYSDLILRGLKEGDPLRANVEEIRKAGQRSALLTHQLLAFSRKQVLQPRVLDINEVVTGTVKMLKRLIGEDIQLEIALDPHIGRAKVDAGQFSQIIMNLTVNARDALPTGGKITIETKNVFLDSFYAHRHVDFQAGPYVMMAVSDNGEGMNEATRRKIFDPFFTTKGTRGTGLGLATVHGIVKQSGGNIEVYSEFGIGTTFKVYLPRVTDEIEAVKAKVTPLEMAGGTETILLVEDEEMVRNLSKKILTESGYTVITAASGRQALSVYESGEHKIDLLVTDVVMPGMGGRELAEALLEHLPGLRVLFTSGYTDDAVTRHGVIKIDTHFMQKPFTPELFTNKVREILDH